ncbi:hypothetical protein WJX79_002285 [Trebouxia sp. C0005]
MPFQRYVEVGRVVIINYGKEYGKLYVITDVVDQNRALIDRPDEVRRVENFKRLQLTDLKIDIPKLAKKKALKEALESNDVFSKFEKSAWGQKLSARVSKATTTDFQRYQWSVANTKKSQAVKKELKKLQKSES